MVRGAFGFALLLIGIASLGVAVQQFGDHQDLKQVTQDAARDYGDWLADILQDMDPDQAARLLERMNDIDSEATQELLADIAQGLEPDELEGLLDILEEMDPDTQEDFLQALAEVQAGTPLDELPEDLQAALAVAAALYNGSDEDLEAILEALEARDSADGDTGTGGAQDSADGGSTPADPPDTTGGADDGTNAPGDGSTGVQVPSFEEAPWRLIGWIVGGTVALAAAVAVVVRYRHQLMFRLPAGLAPRRGDDRMRWRLHLSNDEMPWFVTEDVDDIVIEVAGPSSVRALLGDRTVRSKDGQIRFTDIPTGRHPVRFIFREGLHLYFVDDEIVKGPDDHALVYMFQRQARHFADDLGREPTVGDIRRRLIAQGHKPDRMDPLDRVEAVLYGTADVDEGRSMATARSLKELMDG